MGYLQLSNYQSRSIALNLSIYILLLFLDSPSCMAIATSLVENGYEAGFWRARLGTKKVTHGSLGGTLSQRL
jgi:hypothetical protein